ncbi:SDR family NAD(P)-dependent oxidoreductase [Allonocardiopsis opalescens]|uniref:NAD(P)-dependent dehydrogenase (Short-subunit alcohol dehydrogenase family) n=1 Tax=Allonocardiopsis opalescens TaxID=1144618 RepID=A0A2T0PW10_9ACTN|nr:SDR family oxidoreductase [Allonocardiopsis opalescens]PRX95724.1 NAD(P)-dependent dehydrogenase (short-subunit alcohol dehydrogenase family) [Allonocardiopsis opalescens]
MSRSYVVTGGGRGVGRAVVERLLADGGAVVAIEADPAALTWTAGHPAGERVLPVVGDAADEATAARAADLAERAAPLAGWVNNAAVFRDASVHTDPSGLVLDLIGRNLAPAVVGCTVAVRRFLASGAGGAIVNVSSHQAARAVPGCLPYVTAKAAIEGLTRALAVEYGARGVRVNTVALGSIRTERYEAFLVEQGPATAARIERQMRDLHPVGRVGRTGEVADAIAYLLSDRASFISGATVPVDGGRSILARDPEAHEPA